MIRDSFVDGQADVWKYERTKVIIDKFRGIFSRMSPVIFKVNVYVKS